MDEYVLIGADDAAFAVTMLAEVEGLDLATHWAADGVDLLAQAERSLPLAVFIDAAIGGLSAAECCRQLRNDRTIPSNLPVFLVTDEPIMPISLEKEGFTGAWPKTHGIDALRELLTNLRDMSKHRQAPSEK